MIEEEMVEMILNKNPTNIYEYCNQDGHTLKYC